MSAEATVPSDAGGGDGPAVLSSNALPLGTRIHEFEITRVIGEGGFSVVYLAFDHTLHRSIALKEYIPSALASRRGDHTVAVRSAQHQETFEAGLRSFINEARLLAQFDHPSLVKVYRFWEANGTAYMAMPYYDGRTLKQILREHPEQATQEWLCELLAPLLDALELLHRHRCYHRDIAPDNIQILDNGAPVLLDFGAARRTIGDMTQAFTVILKPGYAPIEQYADEADLKQGPWTDVYALAAVLYGAIVRKPPPTAVARVIKDPLEPLASRGLAGYSPEFLAAIDRGLGVRPEERPQSIAQWRLQLGVQPAAHRGADTTWRESARTPPDAARAPRTAPLDPARAPRTAPPATVPLQREREAETTAASAARTDAGDEAAVAESDRTVLVPGLRRPPAEAPRVEGRADAQRAPASARSASWRALVTRPPVLAAVAVAIVAVASLVVFERTRAPSTAVVSQANAPGASHSSMPPAPAQEAPVDRVPAPAPKASEAAKPALAQAPADSSLATSSAASAGATAATPASPSTASAGNGASVASAAPPGTGKSTLPSPTSQAAPAARTESAPGPQAPERAPSEAPPVKTSPNAAKASEAAGPAKRPASETPPRVAPIAEDDRRWAAIRDSGNVADFLAFERQYPKSPHARTAAARAKALERAEERAKIASARPTTAAATAPQASSSMPPLTAAPAGPVSVTESAASPPAGQALVRVRVRPFGYVYVDGALIGPSPPVREVPLSPGRHRIEARNSDAHPPTVVTEVSLDGGAARDVELRFGK